MKTMSLPSVAVIGLLISGCLSASAAGQQCQWRAKQLKVIGGLEAPECAVVNPATGKVYASNMILDAKTEGDAKYWGDDGTGSISRLTDGKLEKLHWAKSNDAATLHSPKGLCIVNGQLWIADNHQVVVVDIATAKPVKAIDIPGAKFLNDMVSDGKHAYATDTATGRISRVGPGALRHYKGPASPNGLAFRDGKLYCASWAEHEIYEIDLSGKAEAKPVGLAKEFAGLDGIEALPDGSFLVTDQANNSIVWVSAEFKKVETIAKVNKPADFGIDIKRERLYVPCFVDNTVTVFEFVLKHTQEEEAKANEEAAPFVPTSKNDPTKPVPGGVRWFGRQHTSYVEQTKNKKFNLCFLGDSITDMWPRDHFGYYYNKYDAVNFGIGGDRCENVLWRLKNGELVGTSPKVIVLLIGTNNSGMNTAREIAHGITTVVKALRAGCPKSKILLLGVFPKKDMTLQKTRAINTIVAKLDDKKVIRYLDVGPELLDENDKIKGGVLKDAVHPTRMGYEIWARTMDPLLAEMMAR